MIGNMGGDSPYASAIKFSDLLFPIAVPVFGPLKMKLHDPPGLSKKRSGFQSCSQYHSLQLRFVRLSRWAAKWKIQKSRARGLKCHAGFPESAHGQGRHPSGFERPGNQSDGPMAGGSERKKKKQIDTLLLEFSLDRRHRLFQQLGEPRDRTDHGDGPRRQATYHSL